MSETYDLLPFDGLNWKAIYKLADAAIPFDPQGNQTTIANRQHFDTFNFIRHHYVVAESQSGEMVGYGALEQQLEKTHYRQFIVLVSGALWETIGEMLYKQIAEDLQALEAKMVWMREYANDEALLTFMKARGFSQTALAWELRAPGDTPVERLTALGLHVHAHGDEQQVIVLDSAAETLACAEELGFQRRFGYVRLEKELV